MSRSSGAAITVPLFPVLCVVGAWVVTVMFVVFWHVVSLLVGGLAWGIAVPIFFGSATIVAWLARDDIYLRHRPHIPGFYGARDGIARVMAVALFVHAVMGFLGVLFPDISLGLIVSLTGLSAVELLTWLLWEQRLRTYRPRAEVIEAEIVEEPAHSAAYELAQQIMITADRAHYQLVGEPSPIIGYDDRYHGISWVCQGVPPRIWHQRMVRQEIALRRAEGIPATAADVERVVLQKDLPSLGPGQAELIAGSAMEVLGHPIMTDWVEVSPAREAMRVNVSLVVDDVMAEAIPYRDEPVTAGRSVIGSDTKFQPISVASRKHWIVVGATESGKSGLANVSIANDLTEGFVAVAGAQKVYDLVYGWIEPFRQGGRLPLWALNGTDDTLALMVWALTVAQYRQSLPARERSGLTPIFIYLDEASTVLQNRTRQVDFAGQWWFASELWGEGTKTTTSAKIYWRLFTHTYLANSFGPASHLIKENAAVKIAMRSSNPDSRRWMFGSGSESLPNLTYAGQGYISEGGAPIRGKVHYLQELDSSKPVLHDGLTVADIARIRAGSLKELDQGSAAVGGAFFAKRDTVWTPEYEQYLQGGSASRSISDGPRALSAAQATEETQKQMNNEIAKLLDGAVRADGTIVKADGGMSAPRVKEVLKPRPQRILAIIKDAGTISLGDINAALLASGDDVKEGTVSKELSLLKKAGKIVSAGKALYKLPE